MQKFDNFLKNRNIFFIAIVIFTLSALVLYYNRSDILKLFKNDNDNKIVSQGHEKIEEIKNEVSDEEYTPLLSTKSLVNYVSSLKFPESSENSAKPNNLPKSYSNDYINYLLNVNLLVYNFLQDYDYSKELRIIKTALLPHNIKNIFIDLEAYNNNYLIHKSIGAEIVFPKEYKWLRKFIKIEKKPFNMIGKEQDKAFILEKLKSLIDFLYSENFMQEFKK